MNLSADEDTGVTKYNPEIVLVTDDGDGAQGSDRSGEPIEWTNILPVETETWTFSYQPTDQEANGGNDPLTRIYTYDGFGNVIAEPNGSRIPSMHYDGEPRLGNSGEPPLGLSLEETDPLLVNFPQIYALISRCYWQLGKLGEAYDWCSAGRDNNPDDAELMRLAADLRFAYLARRGPRPTKNSDPAS